MANHTLMIKPLSWREECTTSSDSSHPVSWGSRCKQNAENEINVVQQVPVVTQFSEKGLTSLNESRDAVGVGFLFFSENWRWDIKFLVTLASRDTRFTLSSVVMVQLGKYHKIIQILKTQMSNVFSVICYYRQLRRLKTGPVNTNLCWTACFEWALHWLNNNKITISLKWMCPPLIINTWVEI